MSLKVVVLAAGQGTRMCSSLPKVLHRLAGKTLIQWVIDAAESISPDNILIVYGHGGDHVKASLGENAYQWVEQAEQLGTGHAMQQVAPFLNDDDTVLVLNGDVPLISNVTLQSLIAQVESNQLGLLTADFDDPYGFGRIVRNQNNSVTAIVEEKDATDDIREISEINTGIMLLPAGRLKQWLSALENSNAKHILFVIYPRGSEWTLSTIKISENTFDQRAKLPTSWAGLTNKDLEVASGINGALFCHNARFIAIAETRDAILNMAKLAVENYHKENLL